jgi:hypothetical protein
MADQKNDAQNDVQPVAPGTVVTPGAAPQPPAPAPAQQPAPPVIPEAPAQPAPVPQAAAPVPADPVSAPEQALQPEEPQYLANAATDNDDPDSISWTASEFVAHDKTSEWYMLLGLGTVAAAGLMYVLTKDFVSVGVIVLAAVIFGIYGAHKPRQLQYRVDPRGVTIGDKTYGYNEFRTFSVIPEGAFSSIVLMPLKRFAVAISIYYAPQDEEKIVELLSQQLPYEQRRRDAVDSLMRKVRF